MLRLIWGRGWEAVLRTRPALLTGCGYHHEAEAARSQSAMVAEELKQDRMGAEVFDCALKARHRDRAAFLGRSDDPLLATVTERLLDRLEDCTRKFPVAVVLGGAAEHVLNALAGGRAGIQRVIYLDSSADMLARVKARQVMPSPSLDAAANTPLTNLSTSQGSNSSSSSSGSSGLSSAFMPHEASVAGKHEMQTNDSDHGSGGSRPSGSSTPPGVEASSSSSSSCWPPKRPWPQVQYMQSDPEVVPLEAGTADLVVSCLGLHWANDLPGVMTQARIALKPDGLFLAAMFGGETLQELRIACAVAQMEREGGVSPVISPLAHVRDAGNLLTRAGLALPTVDIDSFRLQYPSPFNLVQHLRSMGESNAVIHRRRTTTRDTALAASAVYQSMFGEEDGTVPATYQVMFMTGWSPDESQPKAKRRGSATVSFQDLAEGMVSSGQGVAGDEDGNPILSKGAP